MRRVLRSCSAVLALVCVPACVPPPPHAPPAVAIPPEYQQEVQALLKIVNHYHANVPPELSPHHARTHLRLGIIYYNIGDLDEAQYHLNQSTQMNPGVAEAHLYFGRVLGERGRYREAMKEVEIALELDPGLLDARQELAELRQAVEAGTR